MTLIEGNSYEDRKKTTAEGSSNGYFRSSRSEDATLWEIVNSSFLKVWICVRFWWNADYKDSFSETKKFLWLRKMEGNVKIGLKVNK